MYNNWTDDDVKILTQGYTELGPRQMAHVLGRSVSAVRSKANLLKLKGPYSANLWTPDEDRILLDNSRSFGGRFSSKCIARKLNRPVCSISNRIAKLKKRGCDLENKTSRASWITIAGQKGRFRKVSPTNYRHEIDETSNIVMHYSDLPSHAMLPPSVGSET